ncbi:ATP-binding protein [Phenylobacterium sp.]|uniref:ATP-binding protein n=1 Tax=Phenylobacterium sp. TaxID=1871053 RepID=UPI0027303FB7|nr:ATP-binding protein [Phenylobacterium sp.]MDP2213372.1 ATP-binding protein [Phenylobacterium sp.]
MVTPPPSDPAGARHEATFHAKIAGVALVTTVVVLLAACATFMLQQWAVAREQARSSYQALAVVTADLAAPAVARGDLTAAGAAVDALSRDRRISSVRLTDATGATLAAFVAEGVAEGQTLAVSQRLSWEGRVIGELSVRAKPPELAALLPQFAALTAALFFGGVGVALFLSRSLAHQVIAPVKGLSEAMRQVAASGQFKPVGLTARDDLFGSLAVSFNHLLTRLDAREQDLNKTLDELVEARDAANAANVLKSQFLANMSHEIRTPLNGVLAMADVMAMDRLPAAQRGRLEVIRQSGGLLLTVINDVLDISKIEAGKLTLVEEDFDLETLAATARASYGVLAESRGLAFSVEIDDSARGLWRGDPNRIRQILGNLLSNAVKFTLTGSVSARFTADPLGGLILTVHDTGVGVPAGKLPQLFEKFTQADSTATRRFGGTGLGLSICRELTQMMGGEINARSREGEGSLFEVRLPLSRGVSVAPSAAEDVTAPAASPPLVAVDEPDDIPGEAAPDEGEGRPMRILAAEDNPTNQQVLAAVMSSLGLEVEIVNDGAAAVAAWTTGAYDMILMDIQMPVMDGIAAAREIRRLEAETRRLRTPIVALTANALSHQVSDYLAAGMDDHVAKPIEIAKLYQTICAVVGRAEEAAAQVA